MRVKKFEAKSMQEALRLVKLELGPEAVILSARDNRKSYGLVGEGSVEVTAAVSDRVLQKKRFVESRMREEDRERFGAFSAAAQKRTIDVAVDRRLRENERASAARRPITSTNYVDIPDDPPQAAARPRGQYPPRGAGQAVPRRMAAPPPAPPAARAPAQAAPSADAVALPIAARSERALTHIRSAAQEAWNSGLMASHQIEEDDDEDQFSAIPLGRAGLAAQPNEVARLRSEVQRLQGLLGAARAPAALHPGADFGLPYDLSRMYEELLNAGVSAENSAAIMRGCERALDPIQRKKGMLVKAWVARHLLESVRIAANPYQDRIHLFIGGASSGKTSTLVKMASHLVVQQKKRVAILTADDKKVGAVDQLKIFCQILNVPLAIVATGEDWQWTLSQLGDCDSILVDYPGLQLRDGEDARRLANLLPPDGIEARRHLTISAGAKDRDAIELARRYREAARCDDAIVTNVDQSTRQGLIYNLQMDSQLPLHSFGTGDRIPEDFELASKERALELILKIKLTDAPQREMDDANGAT